MSELVSEEEDDVFRISCQTNTLSPRPNPFGPFQTLTGPTMPRLLKLRAFLWAMLQELMERNATPPAAAPEAVATRAEVPAPPTAEPLFEWWEHWLAVRALLAPHEAAIADMAVGLMTPEMRREWLAVMSVLGVDQAADVVRSIIPEAAARTGRLTC